MKHQLRRRLLAISLCLPMFASVSAAAAVEDDARGRLFLEAREQIWRGEAVDIASATAKLGDYVLAPYLEYLYLERHLKRVDSGRVASFLHDNPDLPVAGLLRDSYLRHLGRRARWRDFIELYRPTADAELRCYKLRAEKTLDGIDSVWLNTARELWLVGRSQPDACDPVFAELYQRDAISADQVWERITLLIEAGNDRLAERFRAHLDPARREWLGYWLAAHRKPRAVLRRPEFPLVGPFAAHVITHALHRLGRAEPDTAFEFLEEYGRGDLLTASQKAKLARYIALRAAYSQDPRALAWLDDLPAEVVTDEVREWTARMALRNQDWPRLVVAIASLPADAQKDPQWRYWRAHSLAAIGRNEDAQRLFASIATERNYYGFLAADRLQLPYNLNHVPTAVNQESLAAIASDPGINRAKEFYRLGLGSDARREWYAAMSRFDRSQQGQAAVLALEWGWYDRAVITANKAGLEDDLSLRFPTPYRDRVDHYSRLNHLEPHVTYAIVRKESAFRADAVSPVGALGLMQVMPQTGKQVARRLKVRSPSRSALLDVDTNLKLGGAYLRAMLDQYDGNLVLAAAAYNAGPHRVADWLDRNAGLPPAVWIEAISFYETRDYVKSILAFAAVFESRLNGTSGRLSKYLMPFGHQVTCTGSADGGC